jgi:gas vesicle protein
MENSNINGKVLGAIIVGSLLGATIGLLFAPYKGSRTRNRIARKSKNLASKLKEEANSLIEKAEELESYAEKKLQNLAGKAKKSVNIL